MPLDEFAEWVVYLNKFADDESRELVKAIAKVR